MAELAKLEQTVQLIARARAFNLVDTQVAQEWNRLARRTAELQVQIRARAPPQRILSVSR
jgi:hypothetical protein